MSGLQVWVTAVRRADRRARWGLLAAAVALAYALADLLLPVGIPLSVDVTAVVTGALTGLIAVSLVLVFRSARVINFAQGNMGGFAATITVLLVGVEHWSYWIAVPIGIVTAILVGAFVERALLGPLRNASRLIVTVATIGVAQLFGALTLFVHGAGISIFGWTVPHPFRIPTAVGTVVPFRLPARLTWHVGSLDVTADYLAAAIVVPLILIGLGWYFNRTDTGIGARGAADSTERALLLGIPIRRLSLITWMAAGAMSGIGTILLTGVQGFQANVPSGPENLVAPLAAAVIAGFDSIAIAFTASIVLGVVQAALAWNYSDASLVDVAMFVIILGAMLIRRKAASRSGGADLGDSFGVPEPRPLSAEVRALPWVRRTTRFGLVIVLGLACVLPVALSPTALTFFSFVAIFMVIGASLLILTGWGGQVSLGQFGFVGVGAATTGWLLTSHHASLLLCLIASALVGLVVALVIGIPALRIRGLYLAVATLAFAVPASTFLLNGTRFPSFTPIRVNPPWLFGRFDLGQPLDFYYLCLVVLLGVLGLTRYFRRSRIGRAALTLRDNERFAAAVSISSTRVRLATFSLSGAIAGLAGGLYVLALQGIPFGGFDPVFSLEAFTMVVVGGMGSVWGAVLGALYVYGSEYFLGPTAQLFTTGGGILAILTLAPGGLADLGYRGRDRVVDFWLRGHPWAELGAGLRELGRHRPRPQGIARVLQWRRRPGVAAPPPAGSGPVPALDLQAIEAGYGHLQILFGVDTRIDTGEVFALLGTNGAGKSTILRVISGLLPATQGRVILAGTDITDLTAAQRVERGVVLVPGGRGIFAGLTVAENLRLAGWLARRRGDRDFLDATMAYIVELFPILQERRDQKAGLLSGGEQQMLTIAQALLCRPRLLMIDELSLGLAPAIVASLLDVIRRLNADGMTIILVEQSMNVATEIAPRAVFLEKGQIRFTGATRELASTESLVRSVFLTDDRAPASRPSGPAAPAGRPVLEVVGLAKAYGGVKAIDDVSLEIQPDRIVGVIGANGAGKTTLFDAICGFVVPDRGTVRLDGQDITSLPSAARFELGLGRTFQDLRLVPSLTVAEVLAVARERHLEVREPVASVFGLPAALHSEIEAFAEVDGLIDAFNLQRYAATFITELSTGTRRIVELAAVAAHRPRVLVLDEPSSGLAQKEAEAMIPLLHDLRDRLHATVAIIEHDIPMIRELSDEVVCMHLGAVLARGSAEAVLSDPRVVSSYLGVDDVTISRSGVRVKPARRAAGPQPPLSPRAPRRPRVAVDRAVTDAE